MPIDRSFSAMNGKPSHASSRLEGPRTGIDQPERAQRVDADARAVLVRVVVVELVPVELVVDAVQRRLHEHGGALVAQHRDQQVRRAVPALSAVEVGQVVVERHRRREDAFLALDVERVEVVDEPVADRAVRLHAAGDEREVPAVRLVVVALRAVDHQREHRPPRPLHERGIALPQRDRGVRALRAALRRLAHQRAQRPRRRCGIGQRARGRRGAADAEILGPERARDERAACAACREPSPSAARRTRATTRRSTTG